MTAENARTRENADLPPEPTSGWMRWGYLPAAFIGLLFICGCQGVVSEGVALTLGFLLLGFPITARVLAQGRYGVPRGKRLRVAGWTIAAWMVLIAGGQIPVWWRAAPAAVALWCWMWGLANENERRVIQPLIGGAALFSLLLPALNAFPTLLLVQDAWGTFFSGIVEAVLKRPLSASSSALGFEAVVLFLCVVLPLSPRRGKGWQKAGEALLLAHAGVLVWGIILACLPGFEAPLRTRPDSTADPFGLLVNVGFKHLVLWGPFVVSIALGLLLPAALRNGPRARGTIRWEGIGLPRRMNRLTATVAALLLGVAGGIAPWLELPAQERGKTVVLYEKGYLNWLRPNFEFFGQQSSGMFGLMPDFLEAIGMEGRRVDSLTPANLSGASVLFVANPVDRLSLLEYEAVWEFVRRGGHLLVIGEHTWGRGELGNLLNVLLEPSDIRFRDDSANFFSVGWFNAYRFLLNPLTAGFRPDWNEPAIVVGASMTLGPRARPLILGRWGYSDNAALADSAGGFLGDLAYEPGEHIGDLVLMATQRFERGRVTAIGDTSGFFNVVTFDSWRFLTRLFLWAAARPQDPPFRLGLLNVLLALVVGTALAKRSGKFLFVLLAGALISSAAGVWGTHRQSRWVTPFVSGNIAYVDVSHMPKHNFGTFKDEGTVALPNSITRYGYLTYFAHTLKKDVLDTAAFIALVTPRKAYSKRDTRRLAEWVEDGGTLMIATGFEERKAVRRLLERFGFEIEPIPLGSVAVQTDSGLVHTSEAWPIEIDPHIGEKVEKLLVWEDYPVAVRKDFKRGRVILIADSHFFCNYNLEHEYHAHGGNMKFLGSLVSRESEPVEGKKDGTGDNGDVKTEVPQRPDSTERSK